MTPERSRIATQDLAVGADTPMALAISSYFSSCPVRAAHKDKEVVELTQFSYLSQILDIALNVSVDIVHVKTVAIHICRTELRHTAAENILINLVDILVPAVFQSLSNGIQVGMKQCGWRASISAVDRLAISKIATRPARDSETPCII